jgi:hypothetical protein
VYRIKAGFRAYDHNSSIDSTGGSAGALRIITNDPKKQRQQPIIPSLPKFSPKKMEANTELYTHTYKLQEEISIYKEYLNKQT